MLKLELRDIYLLLILCTLRVIGVPGLQNVAEFDAC
jgi:hypothetical protein